MNVLCHLQIYLPFLANIVENLEDRFPDLPIIEKFGVFAVCSDEELEGHGDKEVKVIKTILKQATICKNILIQHFIYQTLQYQARQTK